MNYKVQGRRNDGSDGDDVENHYAVFATREEAERFLSSDFHSADFEGATISETEEEVTAAVMADDAELFSASG